MINTTGTTFAANKPIYSRLIDFTPGSTKLQPALAESWDVSPDGKVFTFHLRHGREVAQQRHIQANAGL